MKASVSVKKVQGPIRKTQGSRNDVAVLDEDEQEEVAGTTPAVNIAQQVDEAEAPTMPVTTPAARVATATVPEVEDETVLFIALKNVDHNIRIGHFDFTDKLGLTHLKQNQRVRLPKSIALVLVDRQVGTIA